MEFTVILQQMLVLFFLLVMGFIARRMGIMNDEFDGKLTRLVLDIALPCLILASVLTADDLPDQATLMGILGTSFLVFGFVIAVSLIVPRLIGSPQAERGAYSFMITFSNCGFMGYPVLAAIYGQRAVLYGVIFNIPFNLLVFTVGVFMVALDNRSFKERLTSSLGKLVNPTVGACLASLILALASIHNVPILGQATDAMGALTTPASLMLIGSTVAKYKASEVLGNWRAYVAVTMRLIIVPVTVLFLFKGMVTDSLVLGVLVMLSAMPSATNGIMLCLRYSGNLKVMTQGVIISTVCSIITIPLIATLITLV